MADMVLETEKRTDRTAPPVTDNGNENTPVTVTDNGNDPAPQPNDTNTSTSNSPSTTDTNGSSSSTDPEDTPQPESPNGKFGMNFTSSVKSEFDGDGKLKNKDERNEFLKKEYVDTYEKEQEYDEADSDNLRESIKSEMSVAAQGGGAGGAPPPGGNPGANPAPDDKGLLSSIDEGVRSDTMGTVLDAVDTANDAVSLGFDISDAAGGSEKASNIGSIATNTVGLATGGINTYRDIKDTIDASKNENRSAVLSGSLKAAGDVFGVGSSISGIAGGALGLQGKDKNDVAGKTGDILGAVGNFLSAGSTGVDLYRQNKSIDDVTALAEEEDLDHKDRKALSEDYTKATKAKRLGSIFSMGAGIADIAASGFSIASDFVGDDTISSILGVVGTAIGLLGKGLGWLGGFKENQRKKQNKDSIVDKYVADEMKKVKRHGSVDAEGELSDVEKENIAIARMGCDVTEFTEESRKEAFKDEIFKHIGDIRVEAAKHDTQLLNAMGLADNADDEVIRDALGYGE